ncbi:MAG: helix-turn-helix transcriptional regulator [Pseudomonadales bacterium]|nr:helix-turn-helix transcriptional regulator [Pseudomonadales bacterium]
MKKKSKSVRGSATGRPIMRLMDVLGKRWTLRILWELRNQSVTFRELRERCDDVSPTSLNSRLKELRELNLVVHSESGYEYTESGRELGEHLLNLSQWAAKWWSD